MGSSVLPSTDRSTVWLADLIEATEVVAASAEPCDPAIVKTFSDRFLGIQHNFTNPAGKGVKRVGEASPVRWKLKEAQFPNRRNGHSRRRPPRRQISAQSRSDTRAASCG